MHHLRHPAPDRADHRALGIEFGDIPTKATLADALLHALRGSGVDVVRQRRRNS
jgi:hypothetical protein